MTDNYSDRDLENRISSSQVEALFREVSAKRYKKAVDFSSITEELSKLKQGGKLMFKHLEMIADPTIWPFDQWWRWPDRNQIGDALEKTQDIFIKLSGLPAAHEERLEEDKGIVRRLYFEIFKHIELVSIVLRFIDEYNFAIYSPPVAFIINTPRGYSYASEYLNYLGEIRKYRDIYQLEKVAYVDMFLWSIEISGESREGILDLFHREIKDNIRKKLIKEQLVKEVFKASDLAKAKFYFGIDEFNTAAKWASCGFEGELRKRCTEIGIPLRTDGRPKCLSELVADFPKFSQGKKERITKLRNLAAHPSGHDFSSDEVSFMLGVAEEIAPDRK